MTRSALHSLATVLMLVAACPTLAAAQTLVVQVDNDARIPAADLAQVEEVVARSFLGIDVQVTWEHGEVALDDSRGLRVHLRLLSRINADRKIAKERIGNAVLGQTNRPARLVYIFTRRIVEASVKFSHDYTRILGFVCGTRTWPRTAAAGQPYRFGGHEWARQSLGQDRPRVHA
jgi:hypothetical protein